MAELLIGREHEMIWQLGQVFRDFRYILHSGANRERDLEEAAFHIHALQHMVMAQAAARAYPEKDRLLGDSMKEE